MDTVILTKAMLERGRTAKGGYRWAQIALMRGLRDAHGKQGRWKRSCVGLPMPAEDYDLFLALRERHPQKYRPAMSGGRKCKRTRGPTRNGWTYFIRSESLGPVKIGYTSRTPQARLKDLMVGSPFPLRIIGLLDGNREKRLHRRFDEYRIHGEWFRAGIKLTAMIRRDAQAWMKWSGIQPRPDLLACEQPDDERSRAHERTI